MSLRVGTSIRRRDFLTTVGCGTVAGLALASRGVLAARSGSGLRAGEGVVDITPPLGIELGGFHRAPGKERCVKGIRQPPAIRALVLQLGETRVAICSLDVCGTNPAMAQRIQQEVSKQTQIPAQNVRVCSTHTHSMPAFFFTRQWGSYSPQYMAAVEKKTVEAVQRAEADLTPAELALGKTRVVGGNHNRTTKNFGTDAEFTKDSTEAQRWLDTMLYALVLRRSDGKRSLVWYHFSAHAVCFADELAGPDWPGTVATQIRQQEKLEPSFLQGHTGDVNPGDGGNWRGEIGQTTRAITPALARAIAAAKPVQVDQLRVRTQSFQVPFDMKLLQSWLELYRKDPSRCNGGQWVDAGFAADWYRGNAKRDPGQANLPITLSAIQLGPVGFLFHPAELYSYYGLAIRRDSPLPDTLVVGYTDGLIGYLPDPQAYRAEEYSAMTVPKILDYPPFLPTAASQMTTAAVELLKRTVK